MHRPSPASTSLAAVAIFAALMATPALVSGQAAPVADPSQTSAAVPFIGEFQVWCTDRNPAPFNLCSSHHGSPAIDFGMPIGAQLFATGSGEVIIADDICTGAGACNNRAGNYVAILHPDGTYSRYLHLEDVSVEVGQQVSFGDPIGTNGVTGHNSSPHLHYDEQFPLGTRVDFGSFVGCVDGSKVEYPTVFGTDDWNEVEYGSVVVNDGYECHGNADETVPEELVPSLAPRLLPGPDSFALTAPIGMTEATFEVTVTFDGEQSVTEEVIDAGMVRFEAFGRSAEIRGRLIIDGLAQPWSLPLTFVPHSTADQPTCDGLYQSQNSLEGTPQPDVIIGTAGSDTIAGNGGDDIICAGENVGRVFGSSIFGGTGRDTISGGAGNDLILSGYGRHNIDGGDGTDRCISKTTFGKSIESCELGS